MNDDDLRAALAAAGRRGGTNRARALSPARRVEIARDGGLAKRRHDVVKAMLAEIGATGETYILFRDGDRIWFAPERSQAAEKWVADSPHMVMGTFGPGADFVDVMAEL